MIGAAASLADRAASLKRPHRLRLAAHSNSGMVH
jgi:hypothetical protein